MSHSNQRERRRAASKKKRACLERREQREGHARRPSQSDWRREAEGRERTLVVVGLTILGRGMLPDWANDVA